MVNESDRVSHDQDIVAAHHDPKSNMREIIVAKLDHASVTQSQIDARIPFRLFDLQWAMYELRRDALAEFVHEQQQVRTDLPVEILFEPPEPPRLTPPDASTQPAIGNKDAPVTISIFCNYQSIHCVRMQDAYGQLAPQYPSSVRFVFYDVPLRFHRDALGAAVAARCADQQRHFEPFHKALWASNDALNVQTYRTMLTQLSLDDAAFARCYEDERVQESVLENLKFLEQNELKSVPITLVNGLYLNGIKSASTLSFYIDQELRRLNVAPDLDIAGSDDQLNETGLPLRLEGITKGAKPDEGSALIQDLESSNTSVFRNKDEIIDGVRLESVRGTFVVISNGDRLEKLSLLGGSDRERSENARHLKDGEYDEEFVEKVERAAIASGNVLDTDELPPPDIEYQYRGVVAPNGEKPLSRAWLAQQLENKEELEAHFRPGELEVEGVHMMRLEDIDEHEFYQTLGLQENDVIMRVNGEWLHENKNTLFTSLEQDGATSVVLMRKGLPIHYKYQIN